MAELRTQAGLTQADVAKGIETALQNYQRIEYGLQNVTIRMLVKIAGVIGVRVAVLFEKSSDARRRVRRTKN
jgi:transcriptional regulator with XRE-family HTH domain